MLDLFHVTSTGDIAPCVVTPCPVGGDLHHFGSFEQAVLGRIDLIAAGGLYLQSNEEVE